MKVLHVQPAGRCFESERLFGFHRAISGREPIFSPRSNIRAEPICQARFNRWRWKKKMERGGVVSSKRVNYKKSWLSRRAGKKAKKAEVMARLLRGKESLKSRQWQRSNSAEMKLLFTEGNICSLCHEWRLWLKIILSSKVGSQIAFCIPLHQTGRNLS